MSSIFSAPSPPSPLPALFVSHGSPMVALEPGAAGAFWRRLGPAVDAVFGRPKAIVAVSAHTLAPRPTALAAPRHAAVHDFGGFDERLYTLRYDAPGAPALAERVLARLRDAGIDAATTPAGGLDHGIWTVLREAWPQADVPVLPLAWPARWTPAQLAAVGTALAPLAAEGVLVLATGSITHNLRRVFAGGLRPDADAPATPESTAFRDWFADRAAAGEHAALRDWLARAPHAALMHPSDEHLLPFFVAAGVGDERPATRLHASAVYGDLGMDVYAFGVGAPQLAQALAAG